MTWINSSVQICRTSRLFHTLSNLARRVLLRPARPDVRLTVARSRRTGRSAPRCARLRPGTRRSGARAAGRRRPPRRAAPPRSGSPRAPRRGHPGGAPLPSASPSAPQDASPTGPPDPEPGTRRWPTCRICRLHSRMGIALDLSLSFSVSCSFCHQYHRNLQVEQTQLYSLVLRELFFLKVCILSSQHGEWES